MMLYLFEQVEKASNRYHEDGGLVVVAKSRPHAKQLIASDPSLTVNGDDWDCVIAYKLATNRQPHVYAFPNAGCC